MYPNPVQDEVRIESEREIENVSIFDLNGLLLKRFQEGESIMVGDLPEGIYLLKIYVEDGLVLRTAKFVKI